MGKSGKIALCGIVTSICTMLMFLTTIIPVLTYAMPAMAGSMLIIIVIELGQKWAWSVFAATSVLSILFAGDKVAAITFVLFFGYYPIIKSLIERLHQRLFRIFIKLFVFNIAMILEFYISISILGMPIEEFYVFGFSLPWILLIVGNVVFLLYDSVLSKFVIQYIYKFQENVKKIMRL